MSKNFIGTIILLLIIVVGFIFMPMYSMAQIDTARAQEEILNDVTLLLDKIKDTKKLTDNDLKDFTLAMGSTSIPISFVIIREVREVNPDPASVTVPKETYTAWVRIDDNSYYENGDIVTVQVQQRGSNFYQAFSLKALGMYTPKIEFSLSRMVE